MYVRFVMDGSQGKLGLLIDSDFETMIDDNSVFWEQFIAAYEERNLPVIPNIIAHMNTWLSTYDNWITHGIRIVESALQGSNIYSKPLFLRYCPTLLQTLQRYSTLT